MTDHEQFENLEKSMRASAPEACQECGGQLAFEKVNLEDYQGGKLYLMEKVPAMVCQECGEVWVPEPVMKEFEKMIDTAKKHSLHGKARKKIKKGGKKK